MEIEAPSDGLLVQHSNGRKSVVLDMQAHGDIIGSSKKEKKEHAKSDRRTTLKLFYAKKDRKNI